MIAWLVACAGSEAPPRERVVTGPAAVTVVVAQAEVRLEAATRVLRGPGPAEVRLVGAVHVGDPAYYAALGAFVEPCARVLYEGLQAGDTPVPDDTGLATSLAALGLVFQRDAVVGDDRWVRADGGVDDVRAALLARPDADPAKVDAWLVERDRGALAGLVAAASQGERLRDLARLSLVRGLAAPPPDDAAWWEVVIGGRDELVVDHLTRSASLSPVCVVYGADHLPDLEARLRRRGFDVVERAALPVVRVPLAALQLGPVQVRQFLQQP
jgi:hypothetical protein